MLIDQGVRSFMLSTMQVTSGRTFSSAEYKITSLIGMTIFNNGLQFIIGEEETSREMISAARNVSRDYKLPGRETVQYQFIDNCFENHIKKQCEKLLKGADKYGVHFKGYGKTIKDRFSNKPPATRTQRQISDHCGYQRH